ncbi:ferritin-like domain-containing protein [Hymenobacter sediminis]|uniref:ferritin-like domain-containing protein n=1 Tax=Hymenobacter sediminis TaxID=2218621 RepID=UPI000DA6C6F1|nr:ferritin-like domain-containing protein [Hymenobacter sediminis]RPD50094.1 ferritin-like domain-containing protein [Hymenobacter sediminis]
MSDSAFSFLGRTLRRRSFLRVAGATAASSALVLAGCSDDDDEVVAPTTPANTLIFANGTSGVLNYLYLLEQLQAAFYQKAVDAFPSDFTAEDKAAFIDLRDHEVIHRETLKYTLGVLSSAYDANLTTPLAFKFESFTLSTRTGAYTAARTLKEISVAAYNGAPKLLVVDNATGSHVTYLKLLTKMASVEARHAAFVRDQLQPNSFAAPDAVGAAGLDTVKTPVEVVALIAPYVPVTLDASFLPTT